jgi:hypothetical protein
MNPAIPNFRDETLYRWFVNVLFQTLLYNKPCAQVKLKIIRGSTGRTPTVRRLEREYALAMAAIRSDGRKMEPQLRARAGSLGWVGSRTAGAETTGKEISSDCTTNDGRRNRQGSVYFFWKGL